MNELHYGVCVGIDRYPGFPGRNLASAASDAAAFRDWLVSPTGGELPPENVALITVDAAQDFATVDSATPDVDQVLHALKAFNARLRARVDANPDDWPRTRMYIYAAGHGIAISNGEGAVLMADATPKNLDFNVDLSLYANWYWQCGLLREVVVFVDSCREVATGTKPGVVLFKRCPTPARAGTVRLVGYATRYSEMALEPVAADGDPNITRGFFTQALLEGLNGAALDPESGSVTASSLGEYVAQAVAEKTKPPLPTQHAEMRIVAGEEVVFRESFREPTPPTDDTPVAPGPSELGPAAEETMHTATIHFPAGFTGDVVVRDTNEKVFGRWRASDGDWEITLPDDLYEVAAERVAAEFRGKGLFALAGGDVDVTL